MYALVYFSIFSSYCLNGKPIPEQDRQFDGAEHSELYDETSFRTHFDIVIVPGERFSMYV